MAMPYTSNPNMPRVRMQAAKLVIDKGMSTREAAKYTGFNQSSIVRWVKEARLINNRLVIPTKTSKPRSHPKELSHEIVFAILDHRLKYGRCAEAIHYDLNKSGLEVSLSSVKRTLKRNNLVYPSKWKKWHQYLPRPTPSKPGILVQIDTMRDGLWQNALCAYVLIDVASRWAYAKAEDGINSQKTLKFIKEARSDIPFQIKTLQSDHGSEFAKWFTNQITAQGIEHRHSRVRRPTDNGHVERFIRTLQQECLARTTRSFSSWQKSIPEFIHYYNTERPHMGLNMKTPQEALKAMQRY